MATPADVDAIVATDRARTTRLRTIFDTAAARRAFVAEWREVRPATSDLAAGVLDHARASDLLVASQSDPNWELSGLFDFPERLVLESGRPLLIVPYAGAYGVIGKRITIAWSGKRESVRAAFDALPLLKGAEAVTLLCVAGDAGAVEPGEIAGTEIAAALARHGIKVTVQRSVADEIGVADDILSRVADSGTDLLVMGGYGYSRLREMVFGGVTQHIFGHMTVPTLMSH
jgi:nucleotide-binding universal stress UspA family protein